MSDCDDVNPNVKDICECTRAGMTLAQCNNRRLLWGKPPLESLGGLPPEMPVAAPLTTAQRVKSFVSITAQTVWRVVRLQPGLLTDEEMPPRIDTCLRCEHLSATGHCGLCGCSCQKENTVRFLNKLAHRGSECFDNPPRWGKME